jgi:hypothetical protein
VNGKESKQRYMIGDLVKRNGKLYVVTQVWYSAEEQYLYQVRYLGEPEFYTDRDIHKLDKDWDHFEIGRLEVNVGDRPIQEV